MNIFYLQEKRLDSASTSATSPLGTTIIATQCPSCVATSQYGKSARMYNLNFSGGFDYISRASSNTS